MRVENTKQVKTEIFVAVSNMTIMENTTDEGLKIVPLFCPLKGTK